MTSQDLVVTQKVKKDSLQKFRSEDEAFEASATVFRSPFKMSYLQAYYATVKSTNKISKTTGLDVSIGSVLVCTVVAMPAYAFAGGATLILSCIGATLAAGSSSVLGVRYKENRDLKKARLMVREFESNVAQWLLERYKLKPDLETFNSIVKAIIDNTEWLSFEAHGEKYTLDANRDYSSNNNYYIEKGWEREKREKEQEKRHLELKEQREAKLREPDKALPRNEQPKQITTFKLIAPPQKVSSLYDNIKERIERLNEASLNEEQKYIVKNFIATLDEASNSYSHMARLHPKTANTENLEKILTIVDKQLEKVEEEKAREIDRELLIRSRYLESLVSEDVIDPKKALEF